MRPKTNARIVADGKERLERAIAALPADERRDEARRVGSDPRPGWEPFGRVWRGRPLLPGIVRWLRVSWGRSVDRRLFVRTPDPRRRQPPTPEPGDR